MKILLVTLIFFLTSAAQAYKFTCNSIDAHGIVDSDKCEVACDDEKAARWVPADIEVRIDLAVRPAGIAESMWKEVALSSLESWNNVSGADFRLRHGGSSVNRGFGNDPKYHEIFWVTDAEEWRTKVGAGEKGTLGATLSPYFCPTNLRVHREMYDGDLMMNGSESFHWKASCQERDCQSIRSTLTHELGHLAGLGHPCTLCSNSIMTAKAGFHIEYPMFDDQQAMRTLYPGTATGTLGSPCDQNFACQNEYNCITQEDTKYCSRVCSAEAPCPSGYACAEHMCQFASGRLSGTVGVGESCKTKYCEANLVCAGSDGTEHRFCYIGCTKSGGCRNGETCLSLEGEKDQGVCTHVGKLDESCHWKDPCDDQLICVIEKNKGFCRKPCFLNQKNTCAQGEICRDLGQGKGACWRERSDIAVPPPATPPITDKNSGSFCTSMSMSDRTNVSRFLSLILLAAITLGLRRLYQKSKSS
jgi:hypothetical protein